MVCECCCLVTKSYPTLLWPHRLSPTRLLCSRDFSGKKAGVSRLFLLQGIFLTWRPCLLHWQVGFFCLFYFSPVSHQGSLICEYVDLLFSRSVISDSLRPCGLQHARPPCPSPAPGIYSNSCPSSWWCHPNISSSVIPFSSCLQSFPASGSCPMS